MWWVELKDGKPSRVHWIKDWLTDPVEVQETQDGDWFVIKRRDNNLPVMIYDDQEKAKEIAQVNGLLFAAVKRVG